MSSGVFKGAAPLPSVEGDRRRVLVSPLNLDLLNGERNNGEMVQSMSTATLSFCEVSHRGVSSTESLEYQDKYVTPVNCYSDDNDSDIERARIVEEAALVAEKLMSSQLSKITCEAELRTMETRFPTRVNSPRYYNEKKEVMDRANRMLMKSVGCGRRDCSVPSFFQSKLGWFNCVENFFSVCSDEQVIEENGADNSIETNPYFSPNKRTSPGRSVKILDSFKAFSSKEDKGDRRLSRMDLEKKQEKSNSGLATQTKEEEKLTKPLAAKEPVASEKRPASTSSLGHPRKSTAGKSETKSSKTKTKPATNRVLDKNSYDIENDVFYLDDGAGYITFNSSKPKSSEVDKRPKLRGGGDSEKPSCKQSSNLSNSNSFKNSDIENQNVSTCSLLNVVGAESAKKSPSRYSKIHHQVEEIKQQTNKQVSRGEGAKAEAPSSSPKKECKKKLRAMRQNNSSTEADDSVLNYSSNCIRGRMDYISTDVFV